MKNILRWLVVFSLLCVLRSADVPTKAATSVAVIAPSVSTSMMARSIIVQKKWIETKPKMADLILVVVRSSLFNPLRFNYESFGDLKHDAESQLNISGPRFHIYLYRLDDDLQCTQEAHTSFEARD